MRPGNQNNKRLRGRGGRKGPNPLSRTYESNGPDVKIRGTAHHVAEKYQQLARDAAAAGDRVMSENYFQHAEHYLRIIASAQQSMHQPVVLPRADEDEADEQEERNERTERRGEREASESKSVMPMDAPQPFVENMPVLNGKGVPQSSEEKGESRSEDGGDDDDRGRRRTRGTRGRGVRRSRAAIGEEAGADQAGEDSKSSASASKSEPAALAEAVAANEGTEEKKPRAKRAPRSRAAKAEAETAASDA
jgi:hypothetical protein